MALLKEYTDSNLGVKIPNCYWRIDTYSGIIGGKKRLQVRLNCFKSRTIADTNENKLCDFNFEFTPDLNSGVNFFAQAYKYAKALPEFRGAADA